MCAVYDYDRLLNISILYHSNRTGQLSNFDQALKTASPWGLKSVRFGKTPVVLNLSTWNDRNDSLKTENQNEKLVILNMGREGGV